jgi:hypothetical protein
MPNKMRVKVEAVYRDELESFAAKVGGEERRSRGASAGRPASAGRERGRAAGQSPAPFCPLRWGHPASP